jgi:hypothetical protein
MVSPVSSPLSAPAASGSAAPVVPPLPQPLPRFSQAPPSDNPQGPAVARGRAVQHRLGMRMDKVAALSAAQAWLAHAGLHDHRIFGDKTIVENYRTVFQQLQSAIENGVRKLILQGQKTSEITHLPASVLHHFDSVDFRDFPGLTTLAIPAPASASQRVGRVDISNCQALTELSVAGASKSVRLVVADSPEDLRPWNSDFAATSITIASYGKLKKVDLSQSAATEVDVFCEAGITFVPPPQLSILRGRVCKNFDRQGHVFLHMLTQRADQWVTKGTMKGQTGELPVTLVGMVKLAQVTLVMRKSQASIAALAVRSRVPTPYFQQALVQEVFGQTLRKYLGPAVWIDAHGVMPMSDLPLMVLHNKYYDLVDKLRRVAREVTDMDIEALAADFLPLRKLQDWRPSLLIAPNSLAELCAKGLLAMHEKKYTDATQAQEDLDALEALSVHNSTLPQDPYRELMPESNPPGFDLVPVTGTSTFECTVTVRPISAYNAQLQILVMAPTYISDALCLVPKTNQEDKGTVDYAMAFVPSTNQRQNFVRQSLPPGTTRVRLFRDGPQQMNEYMLP